MITYESKYTFNNRLTTIRDLPNLLWGFPFLFLIEIVCIFTAMKLKSFIQLIMDTLKEWQEDQGARLAAALSYYTTFSIAPLLVLVIAIAGSLGGRDAAQSLVMNQVEDLVGQQGREFVQDMILNAAEPSTGAKASVIGTAALLIGALGHLMKCRMP